MVTGRPHTYFIQIREQDGTSVLSTLCNDPLLNVYAPTHARSCKPRKFKLQFCALHLSCHYSFRLIFSFSFSLRRFEHFSYYLLATIFFFLFFLLLDFLFSFFLPSCFSLFLLFPGHVLTSRSDPFISGIFARTAKAAFLIVVSWNAK